MSDLLIHSLDDVLRIIGDVEPQTSRRSEILLPESIRELLDSDPPDRSGAIYRAWHMLANHGVPVLDAMDAVMRSRLNKYRGRRDEAERLLVEARKAYGPKTERGHKRDIWDTSESLLTSQKQHLEWLVEDVWLAKSHGLVVGEPKSLKSTIAMDMAISVAGGWPFLGRFRATQGPVVMVLNEDSGQVVASRLAQIARFKICGHSHPDSWENATGMDMGELTRSLPIHLLVAQGFDLGDESWQRTVEEKLEEVKPNLVVFDPLYLMFRGSLNHAEEIRVALAWLMSLRHRFGCAVMLVHHMRKEGGEPTRAGQRSLGSTTIHGWADSAMYLKTRKGKEKDCVTLVMEREVRGAGLLRPITATVHPGQLKPLYTEDELGELVETGWEEDTWYWTKDVAEVEPQKGKDENGRFSKDEDTEGARVEEILEVMDEVGVEKLSIREIAKRLGLYPTQVKRVLEANKSVFKRTEKGWGKADD